MSLIKLVCLRKEFRRGSSEASSGGSTHNSIPWYQQGNIQQQQQQQQLTQRYCTPGCTVLYYCTVHDLDVTGLIAYYPIGVLPKSVLHKNVTGFYSQKNVTGKYSTNCATASKYMETLRIGQNKLYAT